MAAGDETTSFSGVEGEIVCTSVETSPVEVVDSVSDCSGRGDPSEEVGGTTLVVAGETASLTLSTGRAVKDSPVSVSTPLVLPSLLFGGLRRPLRRDIRRLLARLEPFNWGQSTMCRRSARSDICLAPHPAHPGFLGRPLYWSCTSNSCSSVSRRQEWVAVQYKQVRSVEAASGFCAGPPVLALWLAAFSAFMAARAKE